VKRTLRLRLAIASLVDRLFLSTSEGWSRVGAETWKTRLDYRSPADPADWRQLMVAR